MYFVEDSEIYFTDSMIAEIRKSMYASRGTTTLHINGQDITL